MAGSGGGGGAARVREGVWGLLRPAPPRAPEHGPLGDERGRVSHGDQGQEMMTTSQPHASLRTGNEVNLAAKD